MKILEYNFIEYIKFIFYVQNRRCVHIVTHILCGTYIISSNIFVIIIVI